MDASVGAVAGTATAADLDATFAALSDPTRRAILIRLAQGAATVSELAAPFAISQPAISKHLKVLERAGLVSRGRDAQRRPCRLEARPLLVAIDWLERYRLLWEERYQALDSLLAELRAGSPGAGSPGAGSPGAGSPGAGAPDPGAPPTRSDPGR